MKFITEQYLIKNVAYTWKKLHSKNGKWSSIHFGNNELSPKEIYESLLSKQANVEMTSEDIANIIGHDEYTHGYCDECGKKVKNYVVFGDEDTKDELDVLNCRAICLCLDCVKRASKYSHII